MFRGTHQDDPSQCGLAPFLTQGHGLHTFAELPDVPVEHHAICGHGHGLCACLGLQRQGGRWGWVRDIDRVFKVQENKVNEAFRELSDLQRLGGRQEHSGEGGPRGPAAVSNTDTLYHGRPKSPHSEISVFSQALLESEVKPLLWELWFSLYWDATGMLTPAPIPLSPAATQYHTLGPYVRCQWGWCPRGKCPCACRTP